MRPKLIVIALLAFAFYLLGARAGRDRYEEIMEKLTGFWNDPAIQKAREQAKKEAGKAKKVAVKKAKKLQKKMR